MHDTDPRMCFDGWLTDTTDPDPAPLVRPPPPPRLGPRSSARSPTRFESTLPGVGSRRHQERVQFHARVEVLLDPLRPPIWGSTEDICHRGVFVTARGRPPQIDAPVLLRIHTVHGLLQVKARVVHSIESVGFGCEFVDLDEGQRIALSLLVSARSCAPRRIPRIPMH